MGDLIGTRERRLIIGSRLEDEYIRRAPQTEVKQGGGGVFIMTSCRRVGTSQIKSLSSHNLLAL